MNHITRLPVKLSQRVLDHIHNIKSAPPTQLSHVIPPGQFSTPPTNVAIPTIPFTCLKGLHGNYVRHCWRTTTRGNKEPQTEKISNLKGNSRPKSARAPCRHTTRNSTQAGALHPLRNHAPDQGHCTRSEEVHYLRIGCSTPTHKNKRGTGKPSHSWPTRRPNAEIAPASSHGDRGRGRGWLCRRARSAYSLTPPAVRPETMYFCRYWNSRITGMAAITEPAAKMPHGAVRSSDAHMYMPTARVNWL